MALPTNGKLRKEFPLYEGVVKFFPDALAAVAYRSYHGSQQHHPGEPTRWNRANSADELDAMLRHMIDGEWEAVAWRALANLQKKIEQGYVYMEDDA
jgi:hypothetical protein